MQRSIRTAALTAILLVPLVTSAPAGWRTLNSAQAAPSYTYRGTIRAINARTGTLELVTGVGLSLRVVEITAARTTRIVTASASRQRNKRQLSSPACRCFCPSTSSVLL